MERKGVLSMYTYSIFSIKSKIAKHYFYKTGILYRFINEFKERPNFKYIQLQYNYVVEPLNLDDIANYIQEKDARLIIDKRNTYLKIYWEGKTMTIYEDDRHLEVTCSSIEDVEEFFFPALRKSPHFYFVISNSLKDYGWLSVKNNRMLDNPILYSFH